MRSCCCGALADALAGGSAALRVLKATRPVSRGALGTLAHPPRALSLGAYTLMRGVVASLPLAGLQQHAGKTVFSCLHP